MCNMITITVNGNNMSIHNTIMLHDFVQQQSITGPFVIVINNKVIPQSAHHNTPLKAGDQLDIMSPITGG